ncbi:flagellar FlbD family protein [bacterium]|nr:flagellar FlbD family protein [bacterium]
MIEVTRLNGKRIHLNGDLIERIESSPDTIVSLNSGRKLIVRETVEELMDKLESYRRAIASPWHSIQDKVIEQAVLQVL